ncbi:FAD-dependent monooxygenase [Puerhibacterium sp. TATVAM-FAB25]|uniref:FAD-dependent monooxygenase n=1 Tax=Puerhibacterium sp. TATVAM-FAB25 TaxID=3093699 RepID=UPI00397DD442
MSAGQDVDVLVVGAGPTGLTAALQAHAHGASVRVVERRPVGPRPSRAMILHPRTLESLRPLGVTEPLLARSGGTPRAEVHLGRRRVDVALGEVAWAATPYPHLTMLRQADVEAALAHALRERGVEVEYGVELLTAATGPGAARATLHTHAGVEQVACRFLAGCDGPASTVRRAAGIGWRGRAYRQEVVLADLELTGDLTPGVLHVVVARSGLVFLFALGEGATWRLLATRPARRDGAPFGQPGDRVPAAEVREILGASGLGADLAELRWSAQVPLQHRMAASFRHGRLFLAGDAAHAHSPGAAQGMNTGILDAVNLGWKLALADDEDHDEKQGDLLASYAAERRPVARQVLALTHAVFFGEASTRALPALLRGRLVPLAAPIVPLVAHERHLMGLVVRLLSQDWVHYRHSPLSVAGSAAPGRPRPGDHLPDREVSVDGRRTRLHTLVASPGIHLLLDRDAQRPHDGSLAAHVAVHRIESWAGRGVVAVRPDGYVGLVSGTADRSTVDDWLSRAGARPRTSSPHGPGATLPDDGRAATLA